MIRTPSLRRRLVVLGVGAVVVVVAAIEVFLFFSMRSALFHNLNNVLDDRARLVSAEANNKDLQGLADRLTELGIRATITGADGTVYRAEPPSPILGNNLAAAVPRDGPVLTRTVGLPAGATAIVTARRSGTDDALRKLLLFEGLGLLIAIVLSTLLLHRTTTLGLSPLRKIAESARRTSSGQRGVRLDPDRPHTHLGQLATAHDEMVAALEEAVDRAGEAQATSEQLRHRARLVIETATAAFVSADADGTITDWNAAAERTFGWPAAEAIGRRLTETIFPPGLGESPFDLRSELAGTDIPDLPITTSARHRCGRVFPVEVAVWTTPDGPTPVTNAFLQDISSRREGEVAAARLAAIVDVAQEAIFSNSKNGVILTWNHGAELLYGFTAAEAIGQPVDILVPPDRVGEARAFSEQVARGHPISRHETVRRTKNGTDVDVALTISPIREGGTVVGASTVARDIAEQRWMAQTLNSVIAALETALDDARASEELSRRFLADAAHQLRTPIAGIRACAEMLLRGTTPHQRDRLLADVVRETARAGRLMSSLMRLARIDQGELLTPQPCDVVALCESEAERARLLAPHLTFTVDAIEIAPGPVLVDPHAVRDILANLLDNARRHAAARIDVSVRLGAPELEIRVSDDGPGVPAEAVDRIFERFVSVDGKGGSGLGLPIARELAQAHQGTLTYQDNAFVFAMPNAQATAVRAGS